MVAADVHPWRETHNVNKVSLEDVAAEAGVSPATIHSNFGTGDRLVQDVVKHLANEMRNKRWAVVESDLPDDTAMRSLNMMQAGGTACGGDFRRIAGNSRVMAALIRVSCCDLLQKEFDLTIDADKNKEAT